MSARLFASDLLLVILLLLCGCRSFPAPLPNDQDFRIGEKYFLEGEFQGALTAYQRFITRTPHSSFQSYACYQMGLCYLAMTEYDRAIAQLNQALATVRAGPLKAQVFNALANASMAQTDYTNAVRYYQLALKQSRKEIRTDEVLFNLSMALMRDGQWTQAKQHLDELLNLKTAPPHLIEAARFRLFLPEGTFIVQLGKFRNRDNALQYLTELRETKDISASLEVIIVEGETFYYISAGKFSDWRGAKNLADQLQNKGIEAIVIP